MKRLLLLLLLACVPMWMASPATAATRFFLPASTAADVNPAFDAGWETNGSALRKALADSKGASALMGTGAEVIALTEDSLNEALNRQLVSRPMNSGIVFTSGVTSVSMQLMVREGAVTDNVDRGLLGIRVVSLDGSTERATLLAVSNYSTTSEFTNNTSFRNKTFADGDTITAGYTTVEGDRLVVEVGYQTSTGSSSTPNAQANWGENSTDLPVNESQTTAGNGWIEFSNTITFCATCASAAPRRKPIVID